MAAKYTQAQIDEMGAKGQAFQNPDGHYSFPVADEEDLGNAIRAVGRSGADHDTVRKYIIGRAKTLGLSSLIPQGWNSDGSLAGQNAAGDEQEAATDGGREVTPVSLLAERRRRKAESLHGLERRTFSAPDMEIREMSDGTLRLMGHASVTETPYDVGGLYTETIRRGAFRRTLGETPDVALLLNHEGLPLARTSAGTLRLAEDDRGLLVDADLDPEDQDTQRLARKMRRGDLDGQMSFAFQATGQAWSDDYSRRDITSVSIHRGDVSIVNFAANPAAVASIRSLDAADATARYTRQQVVDALLEWHEWRALTREQRIGKTLSSATVDVLTNVLTTVGSAGSLIDAASDTIEEAQSLLAQLMDAPDPNADDADNTDDGSDDAQPAAPAAPAAPAGRARDWGREAREWRALQRAGRRLRHV